MLQLKDLPLRNLKNYPGRTAAILFFTILMAAAAFGGALIIRGTTLGMETVKSRLGADILVTPESAKNEFDAQTFLIQAEPGYFYMDTGKLDEILAVEGIEKASPQMFLASATASCCSAKLQIIAFDPQSDFTIQPWIRDSFGGAKQMGLLDIIVGANVTVSDDYIIRLYNNDCRVIGQFAPTGSSLDNAVYTNFDTIRVLIQSSFDNQLNKYQAFDTNGVISAVMIRVKPGYVIEDVADSISTAVEGISIATVSNMVSGIVKSLNRITRFTTIFIVVTWALGLLMTVLLFALLIHERSREFAVLRAMGAGQTILKRIVAGEAFIIDLAGALTGIILSAVIIICFSSLIENVLGIGFIIPSVGEILAMACLTLLSVLLAAVISSIIAIRQVSRIDASLVLKEGE